LIEPTKLFSEKLKREFSRSTINTNLNENFDGDSEACIGV